MKKESKEEIDIELKYRVLILFDITDDKHRLITGLERLICKEDNIRIYKLYEDSEIITYGEFNEDEFEEVVII